jgi:hypothetical protein
VSAALLIAGLVATAAPANVEGTLKSAIEDFEFGEHAAAEKKLFGLLNPIQLPSAEDVILARQYLGACYFLLDQRPKAESEFSKILVLDPEHKLDPQVFSPALVQFFEEVRVRTGVAMKKSAEEEKKPPLTEAAKPKIHSDLNLSPPPRPPIGLAFVPFGVGQFNNRQALKGALFLTVEGGLFATAIGSFVSFNGLGTTLPDGSFQVSPADKETAATLQSVYLATFYAGLGVLAIGVIEALISYPGDAVESPASTAMLAPGTPLSAQAASGALVRF